MRARPSWRRLRAEHALLPCALFYAVAGCNQISGVDSLSIESDTGAPSSGEAGGVAEGGDGEGGDAHAAGGDAAEAGGDAAGMEDGTAGDGACSIAHSNGLGQTFVDCVAAGTHDQTQALAACAASTGNSSLCALSSLSCGGTGFGGGTKGSPVCSSGSKPCACWSFSGSDSGRVSEPATACACPTQSSPTWN
jgi:hypothetical protein